MHLNTFGGRNQGGTTSKGRDISIDWPQDGTTSLKYKAQRERRVPNSSHIQVNTHWVTYFMVNTGEGKYWVNTLKFLVESKKGKYLG